MQRHAQRKKKLAVLPEQKKNIVIQYQGRERSEQNLMDLIKEDVLQTGSGGSRHYGGKCIYQTGRRESLLCGEQRDKRRDCFLADLPPGREFQNGGKRYGSYLCSCEPEGRHCKTTTATTLAGILGKKGKTLLIDAGSTGKQFQYISGSD